MVKFKDVSFLCRFDPDRHRCEKLANELIIKYITDDLDVVPMETGDTVKDKHKTVIELSAELVAELYNKHQDEVKVGAADVTQLSGCCWYIVVSMLALHDQSSILTHSTNSKS